MTDYALFAAVACAGVLLQATVGFGGGLLAIPLMTLFLPPSHAVPSYCLLGLPVSLVVLLEARAHIDWRRVAKLLAGSIFGAPLGAYALAALPTFWIALGINVITLTFAALFILELQVHFRDTLPVNVGVGLLSGALGGVTAQSGPPVIILGISQGWPRDTFRATLLTYFFFQGIMTASSFAIGGLIHREELLRAAVALVPALAASQVGILIKRNLAERHFRRVVLLVIVAVSLIGVANQIVRVWR